MNKEISTYIKNRLSQSDFRKIDFDDCVDRFYYYSDHPVSRLPITSDDFISYIITYYQFRKSGDRGFFEQKKLQIDFYTDKYHIVNFEKLKSEEKVLFDKTVSDNYFQKIVFEEVRNDLHRRELEKSLGL